MIVVTRRLLAAVLSAGLLISTAFGSAWAGPSVVVDTKSGRVLSQEDAFKRWYPASLTKLMS
ncbi:MAG TPA: D-alanyl-D-alanine carboxypeptidase, partial [Tianweitania sediminis]|nr:D-alanyl-D-alanine carboxypeptidase [Tianweitania sediminis]